MAQSAQTPHSDSTPTRRRTFPLPLIALGIAMLLIVGMLALHAQPRTVPQPQTTQAAASPIHHGITSDYTTVYPSIAALKKGAALVLVGTVTGIARVGYLDSSNRVVTDFSVRVERILFDRHLTSLRPGQTVLVRQQGGTLPNGEIWDDGDAPMMATGDRFLFFLSPADMPTGATASTVATSYWSLNDGAGRFKVTGASNRTVQRNEDHSITLTTPTSLDAMDTQLQALSEQ